MASKKTNLTYRIFKFLNLKNLLFILAGMIFSYYAARIIFKPNLSQYPKLTSCFKSSVHSVDLCISSPKYVGLNKVSNYFIHSVLISEDDSFYLHQGIDWREFKKSFMQNLKLKRFSRGGSTITQQLVKNAYLSQEKSLLRKFKEILLAQQVEGKYPKAIILEKYLNVIELGKDIYGVKSASSIYFKKSPSNLNILEAVYLTTLLPNPKVYAKSFYAKKLPGWQSERIEVLLKRLLKRQRISENLYQAAVSKIHLFPWTGMDLLDTFQPANNNLDFLNNLPEESSTTNDDLKAEYLEPEAKSPTQQESNPESLQDDTAISVDDSSTINSDDLNSAPETIENSEELESEIDTTDPDL